MSRSRKKQPYLSPCSSDTMKKWKKLSNRKVRRISKDPENEMPHVKKINDRWNAPDDGPRTYRKNLDEKHLRK